MIQEYLKYTAEIVTAIAVVGILLQGWLTKKAIQEVSRHTNSMKDELVAEVRMASYAKGQLEGTKGTIEVPADTSESKG